MNAVIALCHFCEAHGPSAIFCTQTVRDTKILDDLNYFDEQQQFNLIRNCSICNSIGIKTGIISKDSENNANFLSTQIPIIPEARKMIKQASIRSLSCEVNCSKDDFVFFGDSTRGHVLSHTFHISDIQARGFYQLFSIIILMKDKFFLLNIKPFLSDHLKKISEELKLKAKHVYDTEQENCGSGRNRRLSGGENATQSIPRSLIELTNDKNIFYILHTHFTWILLAGSRILTEQITFCNVPWLPQKMINLDRKFVPLMKNEPSKHNENVNEINPIDLNNIPLQISLRYLKNHLKSNFISACYCALIGIKIIIRGPIECIHNSLTCFKKVLPEEMHTLTHFNSIQYLTHANGKIVTVTSDIPVPIPSINLYRIDFIDGEKNVAVKWHGSLPEKLPNLLNKITKAVDENLLTDLVLDKHLNVLIEEWKNKIIFLNRVKSSKDLPNMKKILGIQPQDQSLVDYWKSYL